MLDPSKNEQISCNAILLVIHTMMMGGTERQVYLLGKELVRRGWSVDVFSLQDKGELGQTFEEVGIRVHRGRMPSGANFIQTMFGLLATEWKLIQLMRSDRYGIVHAFLPLPNFMAAIAGRIMRNIFVVTSKRNVGAHQDRYPILRWMDIITNHLSHAITANAYAIAPDAEKREGCDPASITVIPNGIEFPARETTEDERRRIRDELSIGSEEIAICYVANLSPRKAHSDLIEAFATVSRLYPDSRLVLAGDDRGIGDELRRQIARLNIAKHVLLLGQRSDIPRLLEAMDIAVMASHEEGLSNSLLEKLAAGLPVVATDVGGNAEALFEMPDCKMVSPRDVDDLARSLMDVIKRMDQVTRNRQLRRELMRNRYSIKAMVDAYERLYAEALQSREFL